MRTGTETMKGEGLNLSSRAALNLLDVFVYLVDWQSATLAGFQSHPDQHDVRTVRLAMTG